jgi:Ca2+-binding EF-hand superfamily protein
MYRAVMLILAVTFAPAVAAAQQPCTTDARQVVDELYRHMLERGADGGSAHWVQQLESGRMTVRDLVREIAKSNEHTQRFWRTESGEETPYIRAVGTLYRHILSRQPDAGGARSYAEQGARGGVGSIVDQIVGSREYANQFGDWGVPGSGGIRYCGPNNQGAASNQGAVPADQGRFRGMDRNGDGVIARNEWRGNAQSFENQDWNRDGVLSGDELTGVGRGANNRQARRADRFDRLDVNNNGRIEAREWDGNVAAFNRFDVNNDNSLSREEMVNAGLDESPTVGTTGRMIRVNGTERWTDTGINVRAGDTLVFDAQGTVRLSDNGNDIAEPAGARSGRRAAEAPIVNQPAGALIARIGNSDTFFVGNRWSMRAQASGRLYLSVNDDYLADNSGDFQVNVAVEP